MRPWLEKSGKLSLKELRLFHKELCKFKVNLPKTNFKKILIGKRNDINRYLILIKQDFIYGQSGYELLVSKKTISKECLVFFAEAIKQVYKIFKDSDLTNEAPVGIDFTPLNFIKNGKDWKFIDLYPPRVRNGQNEKCLISSKSSYYNKLHHFYYKKTGICEYALLSTVVLRPRLKKEVEESLILFLAKKKQKGLVRHLRKYVASKQYRKDLKTMKLIYSRMMAETQAKK